MAQQQSQRLKSVCTGHDSITQQHQSFATIRALLFSSITSIALIRNLFPENCFEKRRYTDIHKEGELLYQKFHNAAGSETKATNIPVRVNKSWTLTTLARGKTSGADKVLDWMNVVMEGILGKNLSSVLFSIYADKHNPSHALESYTFSFQTGKDAGGNSQPLGVAFSGPHGHPVTITSARAGLKSIVDALRLVESQLPALPAHRFMMCYLFHKPSNSQLFQPAGFLPCKNPIFDPPGNETWHIEKDDLGVMSSGFHIVGLKLTYVACADDTEVTIPHNMWHKHSMLRESSSVSLGLGIPQSGSTSKVLNGTVDIDRVSAGIIGAQERSDLRLVRQEHAIQKTHSPEDMHCDGLVPTQEWDWDPLQRDLSQQWILNTSKSRELDVKRKRILQSQFKTPQAGNEHITRCECGFEEAEGKMMKCQCCSTWQHNHCYGFDVAKPKHQHYCYRCLLEGSDEPRLEQLEILARFRRALWMAYEKGYPSSRRKFAEMLHNDFKTIAQLVHRMKDEGYLYAHNKNKFALVKSAEQAEIRRLEYLNPMALIKYTSVDGNGSDDADSWSRQSRQRRGSRKRKRSDSITDFIDC